ncbi:MAG: preprotein translocase subunit YajC [Treponema sp.]|jgi:preprotein translocase subunit YajC|nr:preprotein translocase subunit YajC [Treponema sp.]
MYSFVFPLLMAGQQSAADAPAGPQSFITSLIPFAAIIAIFYFLIIRPQSRKQKETRKMLSALKKGDRIVTIGGIHGTIQSVKESSVIARVDDSTKIEFSRSAIASVLTAAREEREEKTEKIEEKKADEASGASSESGGTAEESK